MSTLRVKLQRGDTLLQLFETMPFQARKSQPVGETRIKRGINYATIDWATNMAGALNVLEMTFYVDTDLI